MNTSMAMTKRSRLIGGTDSIYFWHIFQALVSGNIPTKYGQTYGTNVPPVQDPEDLPLKTAGDSKSSKTLEI